MLSEITIKDFAIIDEVTLQFTGGFNALTGETGAGKSIILDAVSLLLGGRGDSTHIRSGASAAVLEAVFQIEGSSQTVQHVREILSSEELLNDSDDLVVIGREVRKNGRNVCRVNGRVVTLGILQDVAGALVDIHGQTEHLSLMRPASHIDLLDRYANLIDTRKTFRSLVAQVEHTRRALNDLVENEAQLKQQADLLAYQVEEITIAKLEPGEDEELRDEARRIGNSEQLAQLTREAYAIMYGSDAEGFSASDLLSQTAGILARLAKIDPTAANLADAATTLSEEFDQLGANLSDYEESIEFDPSRLQYVEMRLDLIRTLKRKYNCDSIEELNQSAVDAKAKLDSITHSGERIAMLQSQEIQLLQEIGKLGSALSRARRKASDQLSKAVERELHDLRMENAQFSTSIEQVDDPNGAPVGDYRVAFSKTGIDRVEFVISPNLGEPLKPISRIASGGETSRIMLALKTVLSRADETPTLIFDEIDSGIGGRIGAVVGQKLWTLAASHQVLVVTHLPQLAGFADTHFKVEKHIQGKRTVTRVTGLNEENRVEELAEMLGKEAQSAKESARELLRYVEAAKSKSASAT